MQNRDSSVAPNHNRKQLSVMKITKENVRYISQGSLSTTVASLIKGTGMLACNVGAFSNFFNLGLYDNLTNSFGTLMITVGSHYSGKAHIEKIKTLDSQANQMKQANEIADDLKSKQNPQAIVMCFSTVIDYQNLKWYEKWGTALDNNKAEHICTALYLAIQALGLLARSASESDYFPPLYTKYLSQFSVGANIACAILPPITDHFFKKNRASYEKVMETNNARLQAFRYHSNRCKLLN